MADEHVIPVKFTIDSKSMTSGLKGMRADVKAFASEMGKAFKGPSEQLGKMTGELKAFSNAAAEARRAMKALKAETDKKKESKSEQGELNAMARAAEAATEEVGALKKMFQSLGVDLESMGSRYRKAFGSGAAGNAQEGMTSFGESVAAGLAQAQAEMAKFSQDFGQMSAQIQASTGESKIWADAWLKSFQATENSFTAMNAAMKAEMAAATAEGKKNIQHGEAIKMEKDRVKAKQEAIAQSIALERAHGINIAKVADKAFYDKKKSEEEQARQAKQTLESRMQAVVDYESRVSKAHGDAIEMAIQKEKAKTAAQKAHTAAVVDAAKREMEAWEEAIVAEIELRKRKIAQQDQDILNLRTLAQMARDAAYATANQAQNAFGTKSRVAQRTSAFDRFEEIKRHAPNTGFVPEPGTTVKFDSFGKAIMRLKVEADGAAVTVDRLGRVIEKTGRQSSRANDAIGKTNTMLSQVGLVFSGMFVFDRMKQQIDGLLGGMITLAKEGAAYDMTMRSLKVTTQKLGMSQEGMNKALEDAGKYYLSTETAASGLASLVRSGLSLDQAVKMLNAFEESSLGVSSAMKGLNERVLTAAEALRDRMSRPMGKWTGLQTNFGQAMKLNVKELGNLNTGIASVGNTMTLQKESLLWFTGLMGEFRLRSGLMAESTHTVSGQLAILDKQMQNIRLGIGVQLAPVLGAFIQLLTTTVIPAIQKIISTNPQLVQSFATAAFAIGVVVSTLFGAAISFIGVAFAVNLASKSLVDFRMNSVRAALASRFAAGAARDQAIANAEVAMTAEVAWFMMLGPIVAIASVIAVALLGIRKTMHVVADAAAYAVTLIWSLKPALLAFATLVARIGRMILFPFEKFFHLLHNITSAIPGAGAKFSEESRKFRGYVDGMLDSMGNFKGGFEKVPDPWQEFGGNAKKGSDKANKSINSVIEKFQSLVDLMASSVNEIFFDEGTFGRKMFAFSQSFQKAFDALDDAMRKLRESLGSVANAQDSAGAAADRMAGKQLNAAAATRQLFKDVKAAATSGLWFGDVKGSGSSRNGQFNGVQSDGSSVRDSRFDGVEAGGSSARNNPFGDVKLGGLQVMKAMYDLKLGFVTLAETVVNVDSNAKNVVKTFKDVVSVSSTTSKRPNPFGDIDPGSTIAQELRNTRLGLIRLNDTLVDAKSNSFAGVAAGSSTNARIYNPFGGAGPGGDIAKELRDTRLGLFRLNETIVKAASNSFAGVVTGQGTTARRPNPFAGIDPGRDIAQELRNTKLGLFKLNATIVKASNSPFAGVSSGASSGGRSPFGLIALGSARVSDHMLKIVQQAKPLSEAFKDMRLNVKKSPFGDVGRGSSTTVSQTAAPKKEVDQYPRDEVFAEFKVAFKQLAKIASDVVNKPARDYIKSPVINNFLFGRDLSGPSVFGPPPQAPPTVEPKPKAAPREGPRGATKAQLSKFLLDMEEKFEQLSVIRKQIEEKYARSILDVEIAGLKDLETLRGNSLKVVYDAEIKLIAKTAAQKIDSLKEAQSFNMLSIQEVADLSRDLMAKVDVDIARIMIYQFAAVENAIKDLGKAAVDATMALFDVQAQNDRRIKFGQDRAQINLQRQEMINAVNASVDAEKIKQARIVAINKDAQDQIRLLNKQSTNILTKLWNDFTMNLERQLMQKFVDQLITTKLMPALAKTFTKNKGKDAVKGATADLEVGKGLAKDLSDLSVVANKMAESVSVQEDMRDTLHEIEDVLVKSKMIGNGTPRAHLRSTFKGFDPNDAKTFAVPKGPEPQQPGSPPFAIAPAQGKFAKGLTKVTRALDVAAAALLLGGGKMTKGMKVLLFAINMAAVIQKVIQLIQSLRLKGEIKANVVTNLAGESMKHAGKAAVEAAAEFKAAAAILTGGTGLPGHATGGVFTRPTAIRVSENFKPEVVAPTFNTHAMDYLAGSINQANGRANRGSNMVRSGGSDPGMHLTFQVNSAPDGGDIVKAVSDHIRSTVPGVVRDTIKKSTFGMGS